MPPNNAEDPPAGAPIRVAAAYRGGPEFPTQAVLLVTASEEDNDFFSSVFRPPQWRAYRARTYREALKCLVRDRMTVIVCDCQFADGGWKDILSQTLILPDPPRVIVTSAVADDLLWAEVLNLGGYDLLQKPFVREEVVRVAELALANWHRAADDRTRVAAPRRPPQPATSPQTELPRAAAAGGGAARGVKE